MMSINVMGQSEVEIFEGFRWTEDDHLIKTFNNRDSAIDQYTQIIRQCKGFSKDYTPRPPDENTNLPIFRHVKVPEKKGMVLLIYCIKLNDVYDLVVKEIVDKDTYLFSYVEIDGSIVDLYYYK